MTEYSVATEIEAAFRKLQILPENERQLAQAAQTLARIPVGAVETRRREFQEISGKAAREEIDAIAKQSAVGG